MSFVERLKLLTRFRVRAPLRINRFPSFYSSHSQFGEDMIVRSLLEADGVAEPGWYVDVGAHHPVYYSNTYHFYRRGWRGVNVDAAPGSMGIFDVLRPRDTNIEACVVERAGAPAPFFVVDPPACSTMDRAIADELVAAGRGRIVREVQVPTMSLNDCFDGHIPAGVGIDLLNIDVEGLDAAILRSNDWSRHKPRAVIFEAHGEDDLGRLPDNESVRLLHSHGYVIAAKTGPSVIMHLPLQRGGRR